MPIGNRFAHQVYSDRTPKGEYRLIRPSRINPDSVEGAASIGAARRRLQLAGVKVIYLLHGTLIGNDVSGLISEIERVLPTVGERLRKQQKSIADTITGDMANYTAEFAQELQRLASGDRETEAIEVRLFNWSSQNTHLGRFDAAVRLAAELGSLQLDHDERVMLWGHSHGGNVFALLTNLLGSNVETCENVFHACRRYDKRLISGRSDLPEWQLVRDWCLAHSAPIKATSLDVITYGTPIRYGWETRGYGHLLHLVNHRPFDKLPEYRAPFPQSFEQVRTAAAGDFLQQFFIAGTNFPTAILPWRSWISERRLHQLLQGHLRRRDLWERLRCGMRVHQDGLTLLIDYATADGEDARTLAGHAVYTRRSWLPFHLCEVSSRLYPDEKEVSSS